MRSMERSRVLWLRRSTLVRRVVLMVASAMEIVLQLVSSMQSESIPKRVWPRLMLRSVQRVVLVLPLVLRELSNSARSGPSSVQSSFRVFRRIRVQLL